MLNRKLKFDLEESFFLFGARGVGKTTLLMNTLPQDKTYIIDLLDPKIYFELIKRPQAFTEIIESLDKNIKWIFIDEVQKLPFLLDEVHRQIEKNKNIQFALTGSSARKLKRGHADLLAGRAFTYNLFPLTSFELGKDFDLHKALHFGTLPKIFSFEKDSSCQKFLRSYVNTYVKEEIQIEGLVRNLMGFHSFLNIIGLENGNLISWSNIASDTGINANTVREYFSIMEDTLMGFFLFPYARSIRKRQKMHPKFYLFDTGVKRALSSELNLPLIAHTSEYGKAFEHFIILEIFRMNSYLEKDFKLSYLATADIEIDLVIERPGQKLLFIEIKSTDFVRNNELRGLKQIMQDVKDSEAICISQENRIRKSANITIYPWQEALKEIFRS